MKLFVIFATVITYSCASPIHELLHPSPVNPDVLVAIKPEEKIILITDPKEIAKFKRETRQPFYPTALPKANEHHLTKRDHTISHQTQVEEIEEQKSHDERKEDQSKNMKVLRLQGPPSSEQHKRDIPVPLVPKHHHPEESPKENSEIESDVDRTTENLEHSKGNKTSKQQTHKRDIPVPLVPKYHHPEETPKDSNEQEDVKNNSSKTQQIITTQKQVSTEGQQKFEGSSKGTEGFSQQQKRESPILPITKHESPKDLTTQHDKKEIKIESFESAEANKQPAVLLNDQLAITQGKLPAHHIKENKKESNEQKPESNEHKPEHSHKLLSYKSHQQPTVVHNGNLSVSDSVKSTTEHPLARPHPVPVAELFARNPGD